jgi:hypothetical protein
MVHPKDDQMQWLAAICGNGAVARQRDDSGRRGAIAARRRRA